MEEVTILLLKNNTSRQCVLQTGICSLRSKDESNQEKVLRSETSGRLAFGARSKVNPLSIVAMLLTVSHHPAPGNQTGGPSSCRDSIRGRKSQLASAGSSLADLQRGERGLVYIQAADKL